MTDWRWMGTGHFIRMALLGMALLGTGCGARTALVDPAPDAPASSATPPPCGVANLCPDGFACVAGECAVHCDSTDQCRNGRFCAADSCPLRAKQIAAGGSTTCVVLLDDTIRCWGAGQQGQLGDGKQTTSATPVRVRTPSVDQPTVAVGVGFACAYGGVLSCWGAGMSGQLGNGATKDSANPVTTPLDPNGLGEGSFAIAAGRSSACAQNFKQGPVYCWGDGSEGELGNGVSSQSATPVLVAGLSEFGTAQLQTGYSHSCALADTGEMRCWGSNSKGQLGVPSLTSSNLPVTVPISSNAPGQIMNFALGAYHSCVLDPAETVRCWGDNSAQQLGAPTPAQSSLPLQIPGLPDGIALPRAIAAGAYHTCVLLSDQSVRCWGKGGAIGIAADSGAPQRIDGLADDAAQVAVLAAGAAHSCALMNDGTVRCWGDNTSSALGVADIPSSLRAVRVLPWDADRSALE